MTVRAPAPEFPADLEWVNTQRPPRVADLRGKVGLVCFWTYDAVNCWNVLSDLRRLADKYHDGLNVVGIHCPKYPRQCNDDALLHAANRLELRHPIANDAAFAVWQAYSIQAWPTIAVIDAEGRMAALVSGEGHGAELDAHIAALLEEAAAKDLRIYETAPPAQRQKPGDALAFPGAVLVEGQFLYVADSGHHRVLECARNGRPLRIFGSGHAGFADGTAGQAAFNHPCGLARSRNALFVADRGNHCVRRIDLGDGRVDTVLGTGQPGRSRPNGSDPATTALNTPLDVAIAGDDLYIAVAGQHQIWRLELLANRVSVLAGSGELGLLDGSASDAWLAQPSGLAVSGSHLVVADAASSAVRWIDRADGRVETLVGSDLYEFGNAVGSSDDARLQNPLAVAVQKNGTILITDSYNNSLKLLDPQRRVVHALQLPCELDEPHGVSVADNRLWIANTNRHEVVCVDLASGAAERVAVDEI